MAASEEANAELNYTSMSNSYRVKLKLKRSDGSLALNEVFYAKERIPPDRLFLYDEADDPISNASFEDVGKNYSMQYGDHRYHFKEQLEPMAKKQATVLDIARSKGCSDMTRTDLLLLREEVPLSSKNPHKEPNAKHAFIPRKEEMTELMDELTPMWTAGWGDKYSRVVAEYATISGAGKTRWLFQAFKTWQLTPSESDQNVVAAAGTGNGVSVDLSDKKMPAIADSGKGDGPQCGTSTETQGACVPVKASVVHVNFNGSDKSFDCEMLSGPDVLAGHAVRLLLFSRGVLECSSNLDWITGKAFQDGFLPNTSEIVDALFEARFGDEGKGLVVIHLDEFSLLKESRIALTPAVEGETPRAHYRRAEAIVNVWIKKFWSR